MTRQRVLFVCTHNSARSQMAEGLLRARAGDRYEAFSAGTEVTSVRPEAVEVMREIGVDISTQRSKGLDEFVGQPFDAVITVCDDARETCPVFPGGGHTDHWSIDDPSAAVGSDEQRLAAFRRARDDLAERIGRFVAARLGAAPSEAAGTGAN